MEFNQKCCFYCI